MLTIEKGEYEEDENKKEKMGDWGGETEKNACSQRPRNFVFYYKNLTIKCRLVERCHVNLKLDNFNYGKPAVRKFLILVQYMSIKTAI